MRRHFQMLAYYNQWANERLYDVVAGLGEDDYRRDLGLFFRSLHGTLNHLLVADRVWMKRFTGEGDHPKALDAIICHQFADLRYERIQEDRRICDWIDNLDAEAIAGRFSYSKISDMRTISQRLSPALAHFFNHQTHHRGQAHAALTRLGCEVPSLDLMPFLREESGRRFA